VIKIITTKTIKEQTMPFEVTTKVGKYTYIYQSTSYRDKNGKPKSKRTPIGKILPNGQKIYKTPHQQQPQTPDNQPQYTTNDIKNSKIQEHGLTNLLQKIADKHGLTEALKTATPTNHNQIHNLATYLIANNDPLMYCQEWLNNTTTSTPNPTNLSSQRISELLNNITITERETFYQEWCKKRAETEYLSLDITSTSTYSNLIDDAEWGYNRDNEKLPQINLCLLMGQTSRLPIYQTSYSGSMSDVATLKTTLAKFDAIAKDKPIKAVMDKGFYSKTNIDAMIAQNKAFLIAVPFSKELAKEQVQSVLDKIDCFETLLVMGEESLRAMTKKFLWDGKHDLFVHIFYNPLKAVRDREKLYAHVAQMHALACKSPVKYVGNKRFLRFFDFVVGVDGSYRVVLRGEALSRACLFAGMLVILSNDVGCALEALRVYRAKDVVEKGFLRLKNSLDLARLRVHSDPAVQNKFFVGFVALILLSFVHNVMFEKGLYKKYTLKGVLRVLSKFRVQSINGVQIKFTPTKEVRELYKAFGFADSL